MTILERVEHSLRDFRPRTQREFIALQICRRFDDMPVLAKYLHVAQRHPKKELLEAARLATMRAESEGRPARVLFFELLERFAEEAA
jgi:hypothetical protein